MQTNFQNISPEIQELIAKAHKQVNEAITETSPPKKAVGFSDSGGEIPNRKVCFKLIEQEDGSKTYEFDYLAW